MRGLSDLLWGDLESDEERIEFIRSGRAYVTGIMAPEITNAVADAFIAKVAIRNCLAWANGRESEWGERAESAFQFLYDALEQ